MQTRIRPKVIAQERTLQEVTDQIEQAVYTIRHLPRVGVRNHFCNWPDIIRSFFEAYGMQEATYSVVPTAKQLSRLDEVIEWLTWVPPETAKIIWARSSGASWRKIGYLVGLGKTTCISRYTVGVVVIAFKARKK